MLQIAAQQCNQFQNNNPTAPFHWPDRVLVCAHEPDEAGNNLQVVMLHRTQRAVFEISTHIDDVRAVVPPLLLHVHDTLYTGLVRKTQDCVIESLPVYLWPNRPQRTTPRLPGAALDGMWTVEWLNGTRMLHAASLIVDKLKFRVMDTDYELQVFHVSQHVPYATACAIFHVCQHVPYASVPAHARSCSRKVSRRLSRRGYGGGHMSTQDGGGHVSVPAGWCADSWV